MTIETANRLFDLRKKRGLSQEELAEKLGVSRQAVSKWERSEASPDTDNLIALAKIYGLTLDQLIYGTEEPNDEKSDNENEADSADDEDDFSETEKKDAAFITVNDKNGNRVTINVGDDGVKIKQSASDSTENTVNVSGEIDPDEDIDKALKNAIKGAIMNNKGITVESEDGDTVKLSFDGIKIKHKSKRKSNDDPEEVDESDYDDDEDYGSYENKKEDNGIAVSIMLNLPYTILCIIAYLLFGCFNVCGGWAYSWIIFLTIPIWHSLIDAFRHRKFCNFAYPVLMVFIYLYIGLYHRIWHPTWIIYLTIAVYYPIAETIDNVIAKRRNNKRSNG